MIYVKNTMYNPDPTCVNGGMYYRAYSSHQAKICINGSWAAIGVPRVTSLPSNPSDGDEVYYRVFVNGGTSGAVGLWHLRYNSSTTYWDFLGGPPLKGYDFGGTSTGTSWYDTGAPRVYIPLNGDYDIEYGSGIAQSAGAGQNDMYVGIFYTSGGSPIHNGRVIADTIWNGSTVHQQYRHNNATGAGGASRWFQVKYRSAQGITSNFHNIYTSVTPVRVK